MSLEEAHHHRRPWIRAWRKKEMNEGRGIEEHEILCSKRALKSEEPNGRGLKVFYSVITLKVVAHNFQRRAGYFTPKFSGGPGKLEASLGEPGPRKNVFFLSPPSPPLSYESSLGLSLSFVFVKAQMILVKERKLLEFMCMVKREAGTDNFNAEFPPTHAKKGRGSSRKRRNGGYRRGSTSLSDVTTISGGFDGMVCSLIQ
ncbi:hypothetical protein D0Y65_034339 [Glycine soja]|uniref:Uncharacterized protein n=1 Tax=Glycine soja TaxID=3848 RepID=A0A445HPT9_GLYSO|nr:hypothetical protein D0Y65_034339 [Glycine soja]